MIINNIEDSIRTILTYAELELTEEWSVKALSEFNVLEYYVNMAYREHLISKEQALEYFKRVDKAYNDICNWRNDNRLGFIC